MAAQVATMALWFSASAVVPQLTDEWGLAPRQEAWLTTSVQLGFVAGALASALLNLADRVPSRVLLGVSGLVGAGLNAAIPLADVGPGGAIALRFLTGLTLAGVYPPGMKLAASWSRRRRGLAIGLLVGALTLGSALPHLLNALPILGERGMPPWRGVLLAASALSIAGSVIVLIFVRPGPYLAAGAPFDWRFAKQAFTSRPIRLLNLGYLGHMWELYAMWTWAPLLLLASYEEAGWSPGGARLAGFATISIGALGCFAAGALADRLGRTLITSASLVVSGACCLVAGLFFHEPAVLTGICLVWGFAVVADSAQFSAGVSELSDARYVGTALTLQTSLGFLLTVATIQLVPLIVERLGWSGALPFLALGPMVGVIAMLRLRCLPEARGMANGKR